MGFLVGPQYGALIWTPIHKNHIPYAKYGTIEQTPPESEGPKTKALRKTLRMIAAIANPLPVLTIALLSLPWMDLAPLCGPSHGPRYGH